MVEDEPVLSQEEPVSVQVTDIGCLSYRTQRTQLLLVHVQSLQAMVTITS